MAHGRREQVKRLLLIAFVVACVGLAVLDWALALGGVDTESAASFLRPVG